MRKLSFLFICIIISVEAYPQTHRELDQPMLAKRCSIRIEANAFIARTFVELEYENPKNIEIEGVQYFTLRPGQVISAFQLDLNGKYRDGSIEERGKANNAYNTIVGKRVDPAILQMTSENSYRLNIYPFIPQGTRKITFTIVEILKHNNDRLTYQLPLSFFQKVDKLEVSIKVAGMKLSPFAEKGILGGERFRSDQGQHTLKSSRDNVLGSSMLEFSMPQELNESHYLHNKAADNGFALRIFHNVPRFYQNKQARLAVFWDVSMSTQSRDLEKEILFLENYLLQNKIESVELYSFGLKQRYLGEFNIREAGFHSLRKILSEVKYSGSTTIGSLDLSVSSAATSFVFTDGIHTRGSGAPKAGGSQLSWVMSKNNNLNNELKTLVENSGGLILQLDTMKPGTAIHFTQRGENLLYEVNGASGAVTIDQILPYRGDHIFLSGKHDGETRLLFGNKVHHVKTYVLHAVNDLDTALNTIQTIQMLTAYEKVRKLNHWQELLIFGLENRIVTSNTAFLVLERIEDYIKYQIAPPRELEEECKQLNYVYSTPYKKQAIYARALNEVLTNEIKELNIKSGWSAISASNNLLAATGSRPGIARDSREASPGKRSSGSQMVMSGFTRSEIGEVVVTSAFGTRMTQRMKTSNVQHVTGENLNTIRVNNINDALAGKVAGLQVRSQSAAKLGVESFVRLRGENGIGLGTGAIYVVNGTIIDNARDINPDDIEDVTVLQGPAAAALFGPDGANGAIVINLKKGKRGNYGQYYGFYKLENQPDVGYIQKMKSSPQSRYFSRYERLKQEEKNNPSFYLDMAEIFYEKGYKDAAERILDEGIEAGNGSPFLLWGAAYIFESWKKFDKAIQLYQQILETERGSVYLLRDLALCYFQDQQYQLALDTYLKALMAGNEYFYFNSKQTVLNDINALVSVYGDKLDLSKLNVDLLRTYPSDLYISLTTNLNGPIDFDVYGPEFRAAFPEYIPGMRPSENVYKTANEVLIDRSWKGKYRIVQNTGYLRYQTGYTRIVVFRNFQKAGQKIEIQHIQMENQYGRVEIGTVKW
jgi:TonB-dependent SusC/RagA subfamily outer membrane receptor